jgi:hypothetical protein
MRARDRSNSHYLSNFLKEGQLMFTTRGIVGASMAVGLMAGGTLLMPSVAGAATATQSAPCFGSSCYGKDPQGIGCAGNNASSIDSFTISGVTVTLRYSKLCAANWAVVSTGGGGITAFVENEDRQTQSVSTNSYAWTKMVSGVRLAHACIPVGETPDEYPCTGWH